LSAKEAMMKALGRGWSREVSWTEIEVTRERGGRPRIRLHGRTAAYAERLGIRRISLALTHTADTALAEVIAEDEGP
jgi:holo-[acyl-carrier protein] synthase